MNFLAGLLALIKAVAVALGWIKQAQDQATGAALQREEEYKDELDRIVRATDAGNDPELADPNGVRNDPANRDNKPEKPGGVLSLADSNVQRKVGQRPNSVRSTKAKRKKG